MRTRSSSPSANDGVDEIVALALVAELNFEAIG